MYINPNMPSVYTIIFTEKCGLRCIFCDMYAQPGYKGGYTMPKQELFKTVEDIVETHRKTKKNPIRLLFSGGEPFLFWDWLEEIIRKYGKSVQYGFNTSGYGLTVDMLSFLSNYDVSFTLSVCGDEQISKWQRPSVNGKYDYWETVSKIFPVLLYYFPETQWKSILSRRMIPLMHRCWEAADRMGFREISFVPDFGDQPRNYLQKDGSVETKVLNTPWGEDDFKRLAEQYSLIAQEIGTGICQGKIRTLEVEISKVLTALFSPSPTTLNCGVLAGRGNWSVYQENKVSSGSCLTSIAQAEDITVNDIINSLSVPEKCPRDADCPYWASCLRDGCIKENYDEQGEFFRRTELGCRLTKAAGDAVVQMLNFLNEINPPFYSTFLNLISQQGGLLCRHIHPVRL